MYSTTSIHFDPAEVVELDVQEYLSSNGADPYWVVCVHGASLGRIGRPAIFFCSTTDQVRAFKPDFRSSSEVVDDLERQATIDLLTADYPERLAKFRAELDAAADHAIDLEAEGSGTGWLPA